MHNLTIILFLQSLNASNASFLSRSENLVLECSKPILREFDAARTSFVYSEGGELENEISKLLVVTGAKKINVAMGVNWGSYGKKSHFIVILVRKLKFLEEYFQRTYGTLSYNSAANFFIIYLSQESLTKLFNVLEEFFLFKVVILDQNGNFYSTTQQKLECKATKKFLFKCFDQNSSAFNNIYKSRLKYLNGCEIKTMAIAQLPFVFNSKTGRLGAEQKLYKVTAEKYNFTINYLNHSYGDWGWKLKNGSYTNLLKKLHQKEIHVVFGGLLTNESILYDFDATYPTIKCDLHFTVHTPRKIKDWRTITKVFTPYLFLLTLTTITILSVFTLFLKRKYYKFNILDVIGLIFGVSVHRPSTTFIQIFFLSIAVFSFFSSNAFNTRLTSFLAKPLYEPEIETVQDLLRAELKIGGYPVFRQFFSDENESNSYKEIYENWHECTGACLRYVKQGITSIVACKRSIKYLQRNYLDEFGQPTITYIEPSLVNFTWMLMVKGLSLRELLDEVAGIMAQAGILSKWFRDDVDWREIVVPIIHVPLSLEYFYLVFIIYFVGLSIALLVFLIEFKCYKK